MMLVVGEVVGCLLACLTSQQHASVSQGRICSDNFTCCHSEREVADQTFYLTQSQYTDTGSTSPSADPITPGAWQGEVEVATMVMVVVLMVAVGQHRSNAGGGCGVVMLVVVVEVEVATMVMVVVLMVAVSQHGSNAGGGCGVVMLVVVEVEVATMVMVVVLMVAVNQHCSNAGGGWRGGEGVGDVGGVCLLVA